MNIAKFSYSHPRAYRRLLVVACAAMMAAGLIHSLVPSSGQGGLQFHDLALALPTASASADSTSTEPAVAPISRLPGSDGSAAPGSASNAELSTPAAAALTVDGDVRGLGRLMNAAVFGDAQWPALDALWTRESNWNPNSVNAHSGACGIPQALPCSKLSDHSPQGQIAWGLAYIQHRYGTPAQALAHENGYGWY